MLVIGARESASACVPLIQTDSTDWWFSSVDKTVPSRSFSVFACILIVLLIVIDTFMCGRHVATLVLPFAASSLLIGTVDGILGVRAARNLPKDHEDKEKEGWDADYILTMTIAGHVVYLALCALLSQPGLVSIATLVATNLVIYAIGLTLMLSDRWRYRVTPLQTLLLIALTLPASIIFSANWLDSGFYLCMPWPWCECGCKWGVSWNVTAYCATPST